MKKTVIIAISILLVLVLAGFTIYAVSNNDFQRTEKTESTLEQSKTPKNEEIEQSTAIVKTEENTITAKVGEKNKVHISSKAVAVENNETVSKDEFGKTKSINANGKVYELLFKEIRNSSENKNHKVRVYNLKENNTELEYDLLTGELLTAYFDIPDETNQKITAEEAKSIAEEFIKSQCDISEYSFTRVSDLSGYWVTYYRYIQGYRSEQRITVIVSLSGEIESYSHNKYLFDGIDTDKKINTKKLDKRLNNHIKKEMGASVKYETISQYIALDHEGKYSMVYTVKFIDNKDEEDFETYYVHINDNEVISYITTHQK